MLKYIISFFDGNEVRMKFDQKNDRLMIGGYKRDTNLIMTVFHDYFNLETYRVVSTQINKMRIVCSIKWEEFFKILTEMIDQGLHIESVKNLGRRW